MSSFEIINDHIRICLPQLNMTINVRHRLSILKHGDFFIFFFCPFSCTGTAALCCRFLLLGWWLQIAPGGNWRFSLSCLTGYFNGCVQPVTWKKL